MLYVEYFDKDFNLKDKYFYNDNAFNYFYNFFEDVYVISVYSFEKHDYIWVCDLEEYEELLKYRSLYRYLDKVGRCVKND